MTTFQDIVTSDFIDKANRKHGFRYNYSKVKYIKSSIHVVIACPVHGEFNQMPRNHLRGAGCPSCAEDARQEKGQDVGTVKSRQVSSAKFFPPGTLLKLPFWDPVPSDND